MGAPNGCGAAVQNVVKSMERHGVEGVYCLGNLIGGRWDDALFEALEKENLYAVAGDKDWTLLRDPPAGALPLPRAKKARLESIPQAVTFSMDGRTGVVFYGRYLQGLEGYSDFEPFALEINMVCDLTDFMENVDAFDALKAMIPRFDARIIIFGQTGRWGYWEIGDAAFVSVGAVQEDAGLSWGLLETRGAGLTFQVIREF
jgi:predicted phosphodiesterase